jgi:hypothetical protein
MRDHVATVAARAQAEFELFREGQLRICLLIGAGVSVVPALTLPFRARPFSVPFVVCASAALTVGFLLAQRHSRRLYWELGRRPALIVVVGVLPGLALAGDGIGSPGSVFTFPALALVAVCVAVGQARWAWAVAVTLLVCANGGGALVHLADGAVPSHPGDANALGSDALIIGYTALFTLILEHQSRHVAAAAVRRALPGPAAAPSDGRDGVGGERAELAALPAPSPDRDITLLTRRDLGLSSRELEVLLLLLAGENEAEIGLRLAWISPGRQRPVSRSTVRKQVDSAARKIAAAHNEQHTTLARSVALFGRALDERQRSSLSG